jgi:hypothetical protein
MARVSLTGKAAYYIGGPTPARTEWETVDCGCTLCTSGRFVALDEVLPGYGQRHILRANLREFLPFGTDAFPPVTAYSTIVSKVEKASRAPRRRRSL